ncbi:MAG: FecR family protein [Ekhidna sp.]
MSDLDKYNDLLNHDSSKNDDDFASFLKKSEGAQLPKGKGKDAIWDAISDEIEEEGSAPVRRINPWLYAGIAAAVALIISFSILFKAEAEIINIQTGLAESTEIELPDGSTVMLNASSTISYSEDWDRNIHLDGEAFFEVTKGEQFTVITPLGNVQVLGTSFNVFARNDEFEVACKTGKVNVSIPAKTFSEDITPGEIVTLKADTIKQIQRLPELMGKWKTGEFYYNNQPFSNVIAELQRQFNVEIELGENVEQSFSGYFTNKNIETALDMVCLPLGFEYEKISASKFVIRENE